MSTLTTRHTPHSLKLEIELTKAELGVYDNPAADGTDGAHPAWWRGHADGELKTAAALRDVAVNGKRGTFAAPEVEAAANAIQEAWDAGRAAAKAAPVRKAALDDAASAVREVLATGDALRLGAGDARLCDALREVAVQRGLYAAAISLSVARGAALDKLTAEVDGDNGLRAANAANRAIAAARLGEIEGNAEMAERLLAVAESKKFEPAWPPGDPGLKAADAIEALRKRALDAEARVTELEAEAGRAEREIASRLKAVADNGKIDFAWPPGDVGTPAANAIAALRKRALDAEARLGRAVAERDDFRNLAADRLRIAGDAAAESGERGRRCVELEGKLKAAEGANRRQGAHLERARVIERKARCLLGALEGLAVAPPVWIAAGELSRAVDAPSACVDSPYDRPTPEAEKPESD
jgi:hypothetical protein